MTLLEIMGKLKNTQVILSIWLDEKELRICLEGKGPISTKIRKKWCLEDFQSMEWNVGGNLPIFVVEDMMELAGEKIA